MNAQLAEYFYKSIIYQRQILDANKADGKKTAYKQNKAYYDGMMDIIRQIAYYELQKGDGSISNLLAKYGYDL